MDEMSKNNSKVKVLQAALDLFYQKGFHATSVRDIAQKASVNISLISYYFNGKQGLLEYAVVKYYENYLQIMEKSVLETEKLAPIERLKSLISSIIQYKHEEHKFSCFIHRELSFDSTLMREISLTYIAKENHYLKKLFTHICKDVQISQIEREFLYMQLKGMLAMPYMMNNEFKQTLLNPATSENFAKRYTNTIFTWLELMSKK